MKKFGFLNLILIIVVCFFVAAFLRVVGEDESFPFDGLCKSSAVLPNEGLLPDLAAKRGIFYEYCYQLIFSQPLISYLERQEKSPPAPALSS